MDEPNAEPQTRTPPTPDVCEEDIEKDDVGFVPPPPNRSGTIKVRLQYGGRRKPIPVDFPEGEGPETERKG
jgi:hypothetical protein